MLGPFDGFPTPNNSSNWMELIQVAKWLDFATYSPYSPQNLQHLRQPVPRDCPEGAEHTFTFKDAFEDLMTVSAGQPMPDLRARHEMSKMMRQMFPRGEPAQFWVQRLRSQGLLDAYFPVEGKATPPLRGQEYWLGNGRAGEDYQPTKQQQSPRRDGTAAPDQVASKPPPPPPSPWSGGEDTLANGISQIIHVLDKATHAGWPFPQDQSEQEEGRQRPHNDNGRHRRQPESLADLFDAVSSAWAQGEKSLHTLFKHINDIKDQHPSTASEARPLGSPSRHKDPAAGTTTKTVSDDGKTTITKTVSGDGRQTITLTETLDGFGGKHVRETRAKLDEHGNEIMRRSQSSYEYSSVVSEEPESVSSAAVAATTTTAPNKVSGEIGPDSKPRDPPASKRGWFW